MSVTEPQRAEVLGWMARNGGSAIEAARHFFPGVSPEDQQRKAILYRKWAQRDREGAQPDQAQGGQRPVIIVREAPLPEPRRDLAELPLLDKLLQLEASCWSDLEIARRARDHRGIALHRAQILELAKEIEAVRRQQGSVVPLEPTPAGVALDLVVQDKAIRILAEAFELLQAGQTEQPAAEPATEE